MTGVRLAYAANRSLGVKVLRLLRENGVAPVALMVPAEPRDASIREMKTMLENGTPVIEGQAFREPQTLEMLAGHRLDYILSVHFPYLFPPELLCLPKSGTLNLHPALLPYNRGWNTPSWAIMDGTPAGATLHWVSEALDAGDIALQREVSLQPDDTADRLYQRLLQAEFELMREAIPLLCERRLPRRPQGPGGSFHKKKDLGGFRELDLEATAKVRDVINRLRGLTTNNLGESAYFVEGGRRYFMRIEITGDHTDES